MPLRVSGRAPWRSSHLDPAKAQIKTAFHSSDCSSCYISIDTGSESESDWDSEPLTMSYWIPMSPNPAAAPVTATAPAFNPTEDQQRSYLWPNALVVATNNPFAFPTHRICPLTQYPTNRITGPCDNLEFAECWNSSISGPVIQYLIDVPNTWCLDILRLGFDERDPKRPIVLHLFVGLTSEDPIITAELALQMIQDIELVISKHWQGESVYIDICRSEFRSDFRTPKGLTFAEVLTIAPGNFSRRPPFPSTSIGQTSPLFCWSGTLTGYVKHEDSIYGVTCRHVAPGGLGGVVEYPSPEDHQVTKKALQKYISKLLPTSFSEKVLDFFQSMTSPPSQGDFWRKIWQDSKTWDPNFGTVTYQSIEEQMGAFDWCLAEIDKSEEDLTYNRHVPYNVNNPTSGFDLADPVQGFSQADIDSAEKYLAPGPAFKPIRTSFLANLEVCLKPPTRKTRAWTIGSVNSIRTSIQRKAGKVPYTLYCIISLGADPAFSDEGDSGGIVFDKNFQPVAMIQSGESASNGNPDVTHAIHLSSVITNMEEVNKWKKGSVVFC